jgi:hypothetical protein
MYDAVEGAYWVTCASICVPGAPLQRGGGNGEPGVAGGVHGRPAHHRRRGDHGGVHGAGSLTIQNDAFVGSEGITYGLGDELKDTIPPVKPTLPTEPTKIL